jgi:N6-adenosine-specific RNA methylase IME4
VDSFERAARRLIVHGTPSLAEWTRAGRELARTERSAQFWIGDLLNYGRRAYGEKYATAAASLGIPRHTLENYAYVAANVPFSRRREDVSFSIHAEIAGLAAQDQDRWLKRAAKMTVAEIRAALRLERRAGSYAAGELPAGRFRIVYADPPWQYQDIPASHAAELHYETMAINEIANLPVRDLVADDAVLFLWVPAPQLLSVGPVIEAWGFEHKTGIVWDKLRPNWGHYVSVRHEHLLICTRGSCTPDRPTPMAPSVLAYPRGRHSEKPPEFRTLIDRLYPFGRRVELFARGRVPAPWVPWGNQAVRAIA